MLSSKDLYSNKIYLNTLLDIYKWEMFSIPLCIKRSQINGYDKYFYSNNKFIIFLVHDKKFIQKYNKIWDHTRNLLKEGFDSELVYNDKCIKTKTKNYNNKKYANFHDNKIPKDNQYCTCLSVILLGSVIKIDNNYQPQIFLEESKHGIKKKKIMNLINENIELSESDDEYDDGFICIK